MHDRRSNRVRCSLQTTRHARAFAHVRLRVSRARHVGASSKQLHRPRVRVMPRTRVLQRARSTENPTVHAQHARDVRRFARAGVTRCECRLGPRQRASIRKRSSRQRFGARHRTDAVTQRTMRNASVRALAPPTTAPTTRRSRRGVVTPFGGARLAIMFTTRNVLIASSALAIGYYGTCGDSGRCEHRARRPTGD